MSDSTNNVSKSSAIIAFEFGDTAVTAFERNGDAWFVAGEVATALGYAKPRNAIAEHCKAAEICKGPELRRLGIPCSSPRGMSIIPERDLYRLVMRSKLPAAEQFEEKVVAEILPAIRKTGGYMMATPEETPEQLAMRAMAVLQATVDRQKAELETAMPKALAFDELANLSGEHNLRDSAKQCGWPERRFIQRLMELKWLYASPITGRKCAYSDKIKAGYLSVKNVQIHHNSGEIEGVAQVVITQKGLARLKTVLPPFPTNENVKSSRKKESKA